MISKLLKTIGVVVVVTLMSNNCYPLSEKGARNYSILGGAVTGTALGVASGFASNNPVVGVPVGLLGAAVSYYLLHRYLYQYTPGPKLENLKNMISKLDESVLYSQNYLKLDKKDLLSTLAFHFGKDKGIQQIISKFKDLKEQLDQIDKSLKQVKNDLDRDELLKIHKQLEVEVDKLECYLNIRIVIITMTFIEADKLLNQKFGSYIEFEKNNKLSLQDAINSFNIMSMYLSEAECILRGLKDTKYINYELASSKYSTEKLSVKIKFLKNVLLMKIAKFTAFMFQSYISINPVLNKDFINEEDLAYALSAVSTENWPLVTTKQKLNDELIKLNEAYKNTFQAYNSINEDKIEYRNECSETINMLQIFINIIENKLFQITKCRDYPRQVALYEQYIEMQRQRKLQQELFERQQALERQRLAEQREHEHRLQEEKLAHERQLANAKLYQDEQIARAKIENDRRLQEQKLLQAALLNQQQQVVVVPSTNHTSYNSYYVAPKVETSKVETSSVSSFDSAPVYENNYEIPSAPPLDPEPFYINSLPEPSASPLEPETFYANNFPEPSAPPLYENYDLSPSYESLYSADK